jgi:hypothetical protein
VFLIFLNFFLIDLFWSRGLAVPRLLRRLVSAGRDAEGFAPLLGGGSRCTGVPVLKVCRYYYHPSFSMGIRFLFSFVICLGFRFLPEGHFPWIRGPSIVST